MSRQLVLALLLVAIAVTVFVAGFVFVLP